MLDAMERGPTPIPWAFFDTPLGRAAMAWTDAGIAAIALPGEDDEATHASLARARRTIALGAETPPPAWARRAMKRLAKMLEGERDALDDLPLDTRGLPPFFARVYELARRVPPGITRTYGELASEAGAPGAARAVGQAMAKNPFVLVVPCHRVTARGALGGFSAPGGTATKERLLAQERARR